jgi:nicotinate-nucleotide adenylyltransferase
VRELPGDPARVGVFGGTFDPPHHGHLVVAANARWALDLDLVLLVVANRPWQKEGQRPISDAADRLAMTEALCEGVDGVQASALELERGGPSYTADTLAELAAPGRELYLVLGRDAAAGLPTWERVEEVRAACTPVLVDRPGVPAPELPPGWAWRLVDIPRLDVSSSDLRRRVAEGRPLDGLVPPGVRHEVVARGLYRGDP